MSRLQPLRVATATLVAVAAAWLPFGVPAHAQQPRAAAPAPEPVTSGLRQATLDEADERDPAFAPRGEGIAVASNRSGTWEIWYYPIRTGGIRQLTTNTPGIHDVAPDWHTTGQFLVFQSTRVGNTSNIWRLALNERGLTQLTTTRFGAERPRYSPDGRQIAYSSYDRGGARGVWVMDAEGRNQMLLGEGFDPSWSPDGQRIAFAKVVRQGTDPSSDIWVMDADGRNAQRLTAERLKSESAPRFSPDGRRIAYVVTYVAGRDSTRQTLPVGSVQSELWIMDADGTNQRVLATFSGDAPAWHPDGQLVAVSANRAGSLDIWMLQPATGATTTLQP